jgi:hypothetical protein
MGIERIEGVSEDVSEVDGKGGMFGILCIANCLYLICTFLPLGHCHSIKGVERLSAHLPKMAIAPRFVLAHCRCV